MTIPARFARLIFAFPWILAAGGVVALFFLRFPPSGIFRVESMMDGKSAWIFPFLPSERVSKPGMQPDGWIGQRITNEPVYFSARVPGPYETADVSVEFKPLRQPLVEFGIVRDGNGKDLDLSPAYASELEAPGWKRATGNVTGYVRSTSTSEKIEAVPLAKTAVWDSHISMPLLMDGPNGPTSTDVSLRGAHDFYFVPVGNTLHATFWFQDANRKSGSDTVAIRVFRGDEEIPQATFALNASTEGRMGLLQRHEVALPRVTPGTYRIQFIAPDDVFIRRIETTSRHWVVGPRLYLGDAVGYATNSTSTDIWTNSRHVVAETLHREGLQLLTLNGVTQELRRTHVPIRLDRVDGETAPILLRAPKGDVRFVLDGFAAFRRDAFFEPKPRRFTDGTDVDAEGIDAVITPYVMPELLADGWYRATYHIALEPQMDTLRFVLSAPGIASRLGSIDVRRVEIAYGRPAEHLLDWLKTMRQELANAWNRL
jgi:hypothetical protein